MLGGMAELLIAITVALVLTASFLPIQNNLQNTSSAATAAWQIATIRDAAAAYIKANWASVLSNVASGPVALPISTLQSPNIQYLPLNFGGTGSNPWHQNYAIVLQYVAPVAPNPAGIMGFVVTYGGAPIPANVIGTAATLVGNYGGYFPYANDPGYSDCATHPCVKGVGKFYWQDMSGFASAANTSAFVSAVTATNNGHLAAGLFFSGGDQSAPYLYRVPEPNDPDLNTMQTDIIMTNSTTGISYSIDNAKNLSANGSITLTGASATDGNITATGNITVTGASASTGNITVNNGIAAGSITLGGTGTVSASTAMYAPVYYHSSDRTLKKNITPIDQPLALVDQLTGHRFQWKRDDSWDVGLVAQEVQQVMPEAVGENGDGKLTVKYDVMVAPLIEAVKVLDGRVKQLESELADARREQPARAEDSETQ